MVTLECKQLGRVSSCQKQIVYKLQDVSKEISLCSNIHSRTHKAHYIQYHSIRSKSVKFKTFLYFFLPFSFIMCV